MKFLCLHGSGTNVQIFQAQTAAIRHELGAEHAYEFVQGTTSWPLAPGLESLSSADTTYWSYCDWNSAASVIRALDQFDAYIAAEGPFDAVLGFSNGAGLAVMHLFRQAMQDRTVQPAFKCAILLNCIKVYDPVAYLEHDKVQQLQCSDHKGVIKIPVANIWGLKDEWSAESEKISELCDADFKSIFVHDGGHEIPGLSVKDGIQPTVQAIRRVLTLAKLKELEGQ